MIVASIIVPTYNEEKYIAKCIESIIDQEYEKNQLEVIFVDGMSNDDTVKIIQEYQSLFPKGYIKILKNPKRQVQYALNIGIRKAEGEYIIRLDAHAEYDRYYVAESLKTIQETGASNVGGPTIVKGRTVKQRAIAAAYHSKFALGGGRSHIEGYEGYADTVSFGTFKKSKLWEIGLYDETFDKNEDDELNFRIIKSGGKIYINPRIKSIYYPRDSFKKLFSQYFSYGFWKIAVIKKHARPARISHIIPALFCMFLICGWITIFINKILGIMYLGIIGIYFLLDCIFSFSNQYADNVKEKLFLIYIHIVLHVSYGLGFIVGIFKFAKQKRSHL